MKFIKLYSLLCCSCLYIISCSNADNISEPEMKKIAEENNAKLEKCFLAGNVESKSKTGTVITRSAVKFINVWKRHPDNSYKLAIDFWNSLGR